MSNTLLTPVQITREALRVLHNNLVFLKGVNRQYSDEFAIRGAKIGSTCNVRKPNKYFVRRGAVMKTQGTKEEYVPLTLNSQFGTDVSFSSAELTLSLDDFSKRVLTPAMARIASQMDQDGLEAFVTGSFGGGITMGGSPVWNYVGTAGITPGTGGGAATGLAQYNAPIVYLNAGMQLDNNACPRDENRRICFNPAANASSVAGLSGLFNDAGTISDQYKKGVIGNALGFEFAMDQNVYTWTQGSTAWATGGTAAALTDGSASIVISGATNNAVIPAGSLFTIAGCYAVNPENQKSTGQLQQFVVTSQVTVSGAGAATLTVAPTPILAGTDIANGTVTSLAGGTITPAFSGLAAGATSVQNLAYHQDAFTMATADLEMPSGSGVDFAARETYDGISMRIVRGFDINNDQFPCRIDVLAGFASLRPELACRILG